LSSISLRQYRSSLSKAQQLVYQQITSNLIRGKHHNILVASPSNSKICINDILFAIHYDFPELFWINWWASATYVHLPQQHKIRITLPALIDNSTLSVCTRMLQTRIRSMQTSMPNNISSIKKYSSVINACIEGISYKDTDSILWDHTIIGPLLTHTAVCEGLSKLFLLYCQHLSLPCMLITGKIGNINHAWNLIEIDNHLRHIDITAELQRKRLLGKIHIPSFNSSKQQSLLGYSWANKITNV